MLILETYYFREYLLQLACYDIGKLQYINLFRAMQGWKFFLPAWNFKLPPHFKWLCTRWRAFKLAMDEHTILEGIYSDDIALLLYSDDLLAESQARYIYKLTCWHTNLRCSWEAEWGHCHNLHFCQIIVLPQEPCLHQLRNGKSKSIGAW